MRNIEKKDHLTPKWLTALRLEIISLKKDRDKLEKKLMAPNKMKAGTFTVQYKTCGRKTCRCFDKKDPFRHGPYYYLVIQNDKNGVRQRLIKDAKELKLLQNYRDYNQLLVEYDKVNQKIAMFFKKIKDKRSNG